MDISIENPPALNNGISRTGGQISCMTSESKISLAAELINEITIHSQPSGAKNHTAAKAYGKYQGPVGRYVNAALLPVRGLGWNPGHLESTFIPLIIQKAIRREIVEFVPVDPLIGVPAIEALRYAGHRVDLREMYAELFVTAMDKSTAAKAHPAFVEIIRQLTPDEVKIIQLTRSVEMIPLISVRLVYPGYGYTIIKNGLTDYELLNDIECKDLIPTYMDNLDRLKIIQTTYEQYLNNDLYASIEEQHTIEYEGKRVHNRDKFDGKTVEFHQGMALLTDFGRQFRDACTSVDELS